MADKNWQTYIYHPPLLIPNPRLGFRFGQRYPNNPIFGSLQGQRHLGQDYLVPIGTPVYAIAGGRTKSFIGQQGGNMVTLTTNNGLSVRYMHLDRFVNASNGLVNKGDLIGYSGNTGISNSGGHLHIDIYNGLETKPSNFYRFIDPLKLTYQLKEEDMETKDIRAMITAIARQYNKGDIFDPSKGAWIDVNFYVALYKNTPEKDIVIDKLYANIDDIKVKQGINLLDAKIRNWRK